jgi:pimeloyl-ACP methyl ester carboxylesterase
MTKVFVHGNPETAAIWGPLLSALAADGIDDVVTLSPPGFGAPTPPGWDAMPASYVSWLVSELEAIDGPIDLVGHDWGAGHVFGLLADHAHLVRSWAADCVGLLHPDYVWHDMAQTWQTPDAGEEAIAGMMGLPTADLTGLYEGLGLPTDVAASMAEAADEEMGRCVLALYRAAVPPYLADTGAKVLAADLPPGLVINATDDAYVSADLASELLPRLGASELRLEGNGHWWMAEAPEQAAAGLAAFWSS